MHLCLSIEQENFIGAQCAASYPQEACGILIGHEGGQVTEIISSPNLSDTPERSFEIDPSLIIALQKKYRGHDEKIIGHYHSHPDGQAAPSIHDQAQNYDESLIWLIVSVTESGAGDMKAYSTKVGQLTHMVISVE